ncbi:hypothetical protein CHU98_g4282 [Xylaria longipes]|nr:hypothetical protein CHU98_g4282 [Xylaria longipes]
MSFFDPCLSDIYCLSPDASKDKSYSVDFVRNSTLIVLVQNRLKSFRSALIPFHGVAKEIEHLVVELHLDECAVNSGGEDNPDATTAESDESSVKLARKHLELVLDFLKEEFGDSISNERGRYERSPAFRTFRMLWLLFKPGCTVYVNTGGKKDACVVESIETGDGILSSPMEQLPDCKLNLWYLDFDGRYVTRCKRVEVVPSFQGEKSITSLNVVPSEFWDKKDEGRLRLKLEDEGVKWYKLLTGKQVQYSGDFVGQRMQSFEGRVYVDTKAYYDLEGPPKLLKVADLDLDADNNLPSRFTPVAGCSCDSCKGYRSRLEFTMFKASGLVHDLGEYDSIDPNTVQSLETEDTAQGSRHRYLICSRNLMGFVFKTRKWETLDVAFCHDTKPNKSPFKHLVMHDARKMMIESLVYKYTDPRYAGSGSQVWGADFIKNKGEGQIFLLHGGPGVGKTFTAECIAEFTGRPLLALTCGDIGTDEVTLEQQLSKWLKLAHKWGAVMLIDEADVFLEKRMESDLKRNSLVSVFLREVEYYQGILFLTTNRVGKFDDAFISRIHVVIHYPDLGTAEQKKIWNQFFDKLEDERGDTMEVPKKTKRYVLEEMSAYKWNGREIRNAFQTAVALAEYRFLTRPNKEEGEIAVLEESDFKQVCDMTVQFKTYLTDVNNGEDEFQRAEPLKLRANVDQP